jgi:predicted Ser/Thr protein kinase
VSLSPGTRLGPYEIAAPLGFGGMGQVYRAVDTRLGREVALKVLPPEFADDATRRHRFEQEARALAALSHPNIAAVYDVGENYFVSELVDGAPLGGKGLSARKIAELMAQVADGLAAAHSAGITHRDLKPDNILVTRDDRVKILDFGLAKVDHRGGVEATLTAAATNPGTVLGTIGYMSPEQVRGQEIDHRSDIFSFGLIAYEMLAGRRAFEGPSAVETMSAIAGQEAPALPETVPESLRRIVERCLEKNPDLRFQSARDLAFSLRASNSTGAARAIAPAPHRWPRRALAAVALVGVAGAAFFAGGRWSRADPPSHQRVTFRRGSVDSARFGPDGQTIVYSAAWDGQPRDIFTSRIGSPESRSLGLAGGRLLAVSFQGEMLFITGLLRAGTGAEMGALHRVPLAGGSPRMLARDVISAEWTPDGAEIAAVRLVAGESVVEWPLGKAIYKSAGTIGSMRVSPAGDSLVIGERAVGMGGSWRLARLDRQGNRQPFGALWPLENIVAVWRSPSEIWVEQGTFGGAELHAEPLSGRTRLVTQAIAPFRLMDLARDGRALVARQIVRVTIAGATADQPGERDFSWLDMSELDDISGDGRTLLITEFGEGGGVDRWSVYLRKAGEGAVRLGEGQACALSPDGEHALTLVRGSPPKLALVPTGAGETRTLHTEGFTDFVQAMFTPDGKRVVFSGSHKDAVHRLWIVEIGGTPRAVSPPGVQIELGQQTVSPDGRYVAAWGPDDLVHLYPLDGGAEVLVPGYSRRKYLSDRLMQFNADGRSLFVLRDLAPVAEIGRIEIATGRWETWKRIRPSDPAGVESIYTARVSRDGKSWFYSMQRQLSDLYVIDGWK